MSYQFITDKLDIERVCRECAEDGVKAFILVGPRNAAVMVHRRYYAGGRVSSHLGLSVGKMFCVPATGGVLPSRMAPFVLDSLTGLHSVENEQKRLRRMIREAEDDRKGYQVVTIGGSDETSKRGEIKEGDVVEVLSLDKTKRVFKSSVQRDLDPGVSIGGVFKVVWVDGGEPRICLDLSATKVEWVHSEDVRKC